VRHHGQLVIVAGERGQMGEREIGDGAGDGLLAVPMKTVARLER
jgi:hypothetical protein